MKCIEPRLNHVTFVIDPGTGGLITPSTVTVINLTTGLRVQVNYYVILQAIAPGKQMYRGFLLGQADAELCTATAKGGNLHSLKSWSQG